MKAFLQEEEVLEEELTELKDSSDPLEVSGSVVVLVEMSEEGGYLDL